MVEPTNEGDLDWKEYDYDETTFHRKELGDAAGTDQLGCSLYELPPGKKSWPYHYHTANEEAMYVLSGSGRVRGPEEVSAVTAGDYLAFPVGGSGGHRVANDGDEPLRYLMLSTMVEPDVTVYPDSGKFGVYAGAPPGSTGERTVSGYYRIDDDVDYWNGEVPAERREGEEGEKGEEDGAAGG